jgi:mercuric ion transport protein
MTPPRDSSRARAATLAGAIVSAIAASSCCLGPLLVAALGIGGAGAFARIAAYRSYVLGGTAGLLAFGFYLTYRAPRAATGSCDCERPRANRAGRVALWLATAVVVVLAVSPTLLASALTPRGAAAADPSFSRAVIVVEGVDCEACAAPIRRAVAQVGGLQTLTLDVPSRKVVVTYEAAPGRLDAYVHAIDALGYEASVEKSGGT